MKFLRSFGQFWYDFIIGDDWKIAVAVIVALGLTTVVLATTSLPDNAVAVLGGCAAVAAFTVSLAVDSRRGHR